MTVRYQRVTHSLTFFLSGSAFSHFSLLLNPLFCPSVSFWDLVDLFNFSLIFKIYLWPPNVSEEFLKATVIPRFYFYIKI